MQALATYLVHPSPQGLLALRDVGAPSVLRFVLPEELELVSPRVPVGIGRGVRIVPRRGAAVPILTFFLNIRWRVDAVSADRRAGRFALVAQRCSSIVGSISTIRPVHER